MAVVFEHWWLPVLIVSLGLVAGLIGGLLGVGGSVIMIPGLVFLFGESRYGGFNQHLYQATAMMANVAVAVPAALRHRRQGAIVGPVMRWMLPAALVFVAVGVWLSNRGIFRGDTGGPYLAKILGVFLLYEAGVNLVKLLGKQHHEDLSRATITRPRSILVGALMGIVGGLLGIGGGAMAVPLQQRLLRLPLRSAIANSAAVMCFSAALGSVYKVGTLEVNNARWRDALLLVALLAPACWLAGRLGASLTHKLPLRQVRVAFVILMTVAGLKMLGLLGLS